MKYFAAISLIFLACCYGDKAPSKIVAGAVNSLLPPGEVQKKVTLIENMIRNSSNKDREVVPTAANDRLKKQAEKDVETAKKQKELEAAKKSLSDSKNRISSNLKKASENEKTRIKESSLSPLSSSSSSSASTLSSSTSTSSSSVFTKFDKDGNR